MTKRPYDMQRRATLEASTRDRIVRATVALHASHGPLGTTYGMIATRAQVAPQTVYNHFPALDTLLGACTSHVWRQAPPVGLDTFRSGRTPAKRLELLAAAVFAQHAFLAPWMRHAWYEAALIPELGAILDKNKAALRQFIAAAIVPEREPSAAFVDAAFVLLDFPAWQALSQGRSDAEAARIASDCLAGLLLRLTQPQPRGKQT